MSEVEDTPPTEEAITPRRGLLKKGAIAAAAVAAAGVATSSPAAAANGDTMLVGGNHTGSNDTRLTGSTFRATGGGGDAAIEGTGNVEGLHGVYGRAVSSAESPSYAVYGRVSGSSGAGVYGTVAGSSGGTGVHGDGTYGVYGEGTNTGVYGIGGTSSVSGVGVRGVSAQGPALLLSSVGRAMPPTAGTWASGSFVNSGGALWYCTKSGTGSDSEWREISAAAPVAPPAMTVLATPTRVYDAREGFDPASGTKGPMSGDGTERVVDTTSTGLVPASASAIFANLTFVNDSGNGFVAIFANGVAWPGSSNLNPSGNSTVANMVVTATDAAGMVKVRTGGSVSGHLILDVFAYLG